MKLRILASAFAVILGLTTNVPQLAAQDVATEINRMKLNIQETERLNQEQLARTNGALNQMNENMTAIINQMNAITLKVQELEAKNKQLEAEVVLLRKQVQAESEARQETMRKFANEVTKELGSSRQTVQTPPPSSQSSSNTPEGEYHEYIVQKGATLSAIAKAANVSVSDIRKANNMSSDTLRIGQKLLIPIKK